jgi:sarcosine oxidase delta subunit
MQVEQWQELPDNVIVTCPYCGHRPEDLSDFITSQQLQRARSAMEALAEQYVHQMVQKAFRPLRERRSRGSGIEIKVSHDPPPPVRSLTTYVEQQVRRTIVCGKCATVCAVYGATAFCPLCGPRVATETVVEAIERGRRSLALEDALPSDLREQARSEGIFDRAAGDAIKDVVSLFEVFVRDQFEMRVAGHEEIVMHRGRGVFQRLNDVDAMFAEHVGVPISACVPEAVWSQLQAVFQQRHVLVHKKGIIDEQYVQRVPQGGYQIGQQLVLSRRDAEQAPDLRRGCF